MNLKINKGLVLVLLFMTIQVHAQSSFESIYLEYLKAKKQGSSWFENIEGSPYFYADFEEAKVYLNGSMVPTIAEMRFNNCFGEMEFLSGNGDEYLLLDEKDKVDSIMLNGKVYRYLPYVDIKNEKKAYFIRLTNRELELYVKRSKSFREERAPQSGYEEFLPAAFIDEKDVFYIGLANEPLLLIPGRKKKIITFFNELGYTNSNAVKLKYEESDLISYVNGLKKK